MTMLTERAENQSILEEILGLTWTSKLRIGNYSEVSFFFRHGEYHIITKDGITKTKAVGTGRIYRFVVRTYATVWTWIARMYYLD